MSAATAVRPRRIAIVSHSRARIGGVESYVATLVPALRRSGHTVGCWFETAGHGPDRVIAADDRGPCWVASEQAGAAVGELAAWRPDVIYAHGLVSPSHERAVMRVAPAVFFAHAYYGVCVSGTKSWQLPVVQPCQRTFGPACLAEYYPRRCGGWNPLTLARHYQLQRDRLELLRGYARILVASRHMADEYARHGLGSSVRVVSLPVESARPKAGVATPADDPRRPWRLLFLGRFESTKGVDIALESAAIVASATAREVHLQLSGEGSRRARLASRAAALVGQRANLRVEMTPWLSSDAAADALDHADLLLVPSLWPEPFGMVGVEAARRGVPSVAFAVGGIPEWLIDGATGTLVPPRPPTAKAFAAAITATLSNDGAWRGMRAACPGAVRRFDVDTHLQALDAVFDEVSGADILKAGAARHHGAEAREAWDL
jgi:glycosyltransferase involved in cell wall biosynthesis